MSGNVQEPCLRFIGEVHSVLKKREDCPRQGNEFAPGATVFIYPQFLDGLSDIKEGDEIILLTWLHESDRSVLQCHPRNRSDIKLTGVFSTRSPDRPNPIGLHPVKVISISANTLEVSGLEVIDGTPVVDIKPGRPKKDSIPQGDEQPH